MIGFAVNLYKNIQEFSFYYCKKKKKDIYLEYPDLKEKISNSWSESIKPLLSEDKDSVWKDIISEVKISDNLSHEEKTIFLSGLIFRSLWECNFKKPQDQHIFPALIKWTCAIEVESFRNEAWNYVASRLIEMKESSKSINFSDILSSSFEMMSSKEKSNFIKLNGIYLPNCENINISINNRSIRKFLKSYYITMQLSGYRCELKDNFTLKEECKAFLLSFPKLLMTMNSKNSETLLLCRHVLKKSGKVFWSIPKPVLFLIMANVFISENSN